MTERNQDEERLDQAGRDFAISEEAFDTETERRFLDNRPGGIPLGAGEQTGLEFDLLNDQTGREMRVVRPVGGTADSAVMGVGSFTVPNSMLEEVEKLNNAAQNVVAGAKVTPQWRQMLRVFVSNKLAVASVILLLLVVGGCFLGPHFYHTNQTDSLQLAIDCTNPSGCTNLPPSAQHPLGTDINGWDQLGRIMYGGQYSLTLGALAGVITIVLGTLYGLVSGFLGGWVDVVLMRIIDAFLSIPGLFLLVALVAIFGRSTQFLILVIGLTGWFGNARIIRGDALVIRELEYAQAASSMGGGKFHIIRRHVIPNSMGNIVTVGTFSVADAILALSGIGFIGLGIQLPGTDWGSMLAGAIGQLQQGTWWEVYPTCGVFILTVVAINYIGDAMRDMYEVRLFER